MEGFYAKAYVDLMELGELYRDRWERPPVGGRARAVTPRRQEPRRFPTLAALLPRRVQRRTSPLV